MFERIRGYLKFKAAEAEYKAQGMPDFDIDPDELPEYFRPKFYSKKIRDAVRKASRLLDVEKPRIVYLPYMSDYKVIMISDKLQKGIPRQNYVGGIYDEKRNIIYICIYDVKHELETGEQKLADEMELVHTALHELRHAYQKKHEEDVYYEEDNAVGAIAHINDLSEIDADAFSLAYTLNNVDNNPEHLSENLVMFAQLDKGLRAKRAHEICKKHDWTVLFVTMDYIPEEFKGRLNVEARKMLGLKPDRRRQIPLR